MRKESPPCGTLSCVGCDSAPNLEVDTDVVAVDVVAADVVAADSEPSPDIQGQHGMTSSSCRRIHHTRSQCCLTPWTVALV